VSVGQLHAAVVARDAELCHDLVLSKDYDLIFKPLI
jgi:hypothetical protein